MKQSTTINLVFINVLAASILACNSVPEESKTCVDENGVVIDESRCNPGSSGYNPHYRWYYGGGLFNHGARVSGGGYSPSPGHSYLTPSQRTSVHSGSGTGTGNHSSPSITRGGFGSSGFASGG